MNTTPSGLTHDHSPCTSNTLEGSHVTPGGSLVTSCILSVICVCIVCVYTRCTHSHSLHSFGNVFVINDRGLKSSNEGRPGRGWGGSPHPLLQHCMEADVHKTIVSLYNLQRVVLESRALHIFISCTDLSSIIVNVQFYGQTVPVRTQFFCN